MFAGYLRAQVFLAEKNHNYVISISNTFQFLPAYQKNEMKLNWNKIE